MEKPDLSKSERYLLALRTRELRQVIRIIGHGKKSILEIGGGNGWQAYLLRKMGYDVVSVDISPYTKAASFSAVMQYDGRNLPFTDNSFDIIFSSNVLEHVCDLTNFEMELHRVLKKDGYAIHVLPTASWRIWTSLLHPVFVLRAVFQKSMRSKMKNNGNATAGSKRNWLHAIIPNRHGEKGNFITEIYWFSAIAWGRHFKKCDWTVKRIISTSLAYTGNMALHMHLSMASRRRLAKYIGSSTKVYVLAH